MAKININMNEIETRLCKEIATNFNIAGDEVRVCSALGDLMMVSTIAIKEDPLFNSNVRGGVWRKKELSEGSSDPNEFEIVFPSLGYAIERNGDEVRIDEEGFTMVDNRKRVEERVKCGNVKFMLCHGGMVVRLAIYKGQLLSMTHTNMNSSKTRWGNASLTELSQKLGLPNHASVFGDVNQDDITTCAHFMLVHPRCVTVTRQNLNGFGYIVCLGAARSSVTTTDRWVAPMTTPTTDDFPGKLEHDLGVINPVCIPTENVNEMLKYGFYDSKKVVDERLLTGESVMALVDGAYMIKITPPSVLWRESMRGGDPSIRNRFFTLLSDVYDPDTFRKNYFFLDANVHQIKTVVTEGDSFVWATEYTPTIEYLERLRTDTGERARIIFINYILSLPVTEQLDALSLFDEYINGIDKLVKFIMMVRSGYFHFIDPKNLKCVGSIHGQYTRENGHVYHKGESNLCYDITDELYRTPHSSQLVLMKAPHRRINDIIKQANLHANRNVRGRVSNVHFDKMVTRNINFLLSKEGLDSNGNSTLYKMIRQCDAWVTPEDVNGK
jgi:hypothetical protein